MSMLSPEKERQVREGFASQGMLRALGAVMTEVGPGRCTLELPFSDAVSQQRGFFHGGAIGALADTAGGYAAFTLLPEGTDVLTLEYKVNFLRPGAGERLVAEAAVLRSGRTVSVVRVDVHAVSGGERKLCAAMQQSVATAPSRDG
jgi:uncharacterized protein (TIGR00369 family)